MSLMGYRETVSGPAYTWADTTIWFRWGVDPAVIIGDRVITIDDPSRFGSWDTPAHRRAYVRNFTA